MFLCDLILGIQILHLNIWTISLFFEVIYRFWRGGTRLRIFSSFFSPRLLEKLPVHDHRRQQLEQLMLEWNADIAHVYPKFLDVQRLGHDAHLLNSDSWRIKLEVILGGSSSTCTSATLVFSMPM